MKNYSIAISLLIFVITHDVIDTSPTDLHFMGINIAVNKTANQTPGTYMDPINTQTKDHRSYPASLAVDGVINSNFLEDLTERLKGFQVYGFRERSWFAIYNDYGKNKYNDNKIEIKVEPVQSISKVAIRLPTYKDRVTYLTLCEVEIFAEVCESISIDHGIVNPNKKFHEVSSSANVTCDFGYQTKTPIITCEKMQNEFRWNNNPKCDIIKCNYPGKPANGYYENYMTAKEFKANQSLQFKFNSSILLKCHKGYENLNITYITCQSNGHWSVSQPECKKKECPYLGDIANGEYRFANMSLYSDIPSYFNTTVYLTCHNGYNLSGDEKRICNDQKVWEGVSSCQIVHCAPPRLPEHALYIEKDIDGSFITYSGEKFIYQDKIRVVCSEGYTLNNTPTVRQCLETTEWSGKADYCILVTCNELEELKGGFYRYSTNKLSNGFPFNTTVVTACNEPFRLSNPSNTSRKCGEKGEWDNEPALCIRPAEYAAQSNNSALVGGVSAAIVVIISIIVAIVFYIYRRRRKNIGNRTGKPKPYSNLKKKNNNQESLTNTQDDVYSEIQETRFSSISDRAASVPARDEMYINLSEKTDKNKLKHSNQSSVSLQSDAYYSFTNVDKVPESAILVKDLSDLILTGSDSKRKFEKEFQALPQGMVEAHREAIKKKNITKNRYRNLYAYDDTRVVLEADESSQSDYINACYVHGFNKVRQYIASQGPTKEILLDFWKMIWQQGSTKIVMLTNLVEEGMEKCLQYWPEEGTNHVFGNIKVHTEKEDNFSQFVKRIFHLKKDGSKQRTITQYHFTAWPDKGVPKYASSLVQFTNKVKHDSVVDNGPIVVHCSAGVGRTGTFIALDFLTEQGKEMGYIDVFGTIKVFRSQRVSLVQTLDQYIFVHHALVESLMLPTSALPAYKFPEAFQELLQMDTKKKKPKLNLEFETLKKVSPVADEGEYVSSKLVRNRRKNRYSNVLPVEDFMPSLMSKHSDSDNRYINAVFLSSYKERKAFIITQTPLENTREDFWDLIWEHDVHTIVMMNNIKETVGDKRKNDITLRVPFDSDVRSEHIVDLWEFQDSEKYWPETNESVTYGSLVITNDGVETKNHHQLVSLSAQKHKVTRKVKQIRCGGWRYNHSLPDSPEVILTLLELVKIWQRQSGHHTIVVHCMNGVDKSGLYCVISAVIERLQIEQDVAISQVTEEMRNAREQIIPSVEQYKFCHETVLAFVHQFDTYSNFAE